jgi:hypothetical protein
MGRAKESRDVSWHLGHLNAGKIVNRREGEARSRLSRGLIEFVVIVTSILEAFGLEAWWGTRVDKERSRAQVESLHAEFSATRAELRVGLESLRTAVAAVLPLIG